MRFLYRGLLAAGLLAPLAGHALPLSLRRLLANGQLVCTVYHSLLVRADSTLYA